MGKRAKGFQVDRKAPVDKRNDAGMASKPPVTKDRFGRSKKGLAAEK